MGYNHLCPPPLNAPPILSLTGWVWHHEHQAGDGDPHHAVIACRAVWTAWVCWAAACADAELLYEAKYGKRGVDGKMTREQYQALRRRVGGTGEGGCGPGTPAIQQSRACRQYCKRTAPAAWRPPGDVANT